MVRMFVIVFIEQLIVTMQAKEERKKLHYRFSNASAMDLSYDFMFAFHFPYWRIAKRRKRVQKK